MAELVFLFLKKNKHLLSMLFIAIQLNTSFSEPNYEIRKRKRARRIIRITRVLKVQTKSIG